VRKILPLLLLSVLVALPAQAGCYSTGQHPAATEVSNAITAGPQKLMLAAAVNYDASNAKVAMIFDSATVPGTGTIPVMVVPLAAAVSATQPTPGSFSVPVSGWQLSKGISIGCSSTAQTYTADGSANCFFEVCWQ